MNSLTSHLPLINLDRLHERSRTTAASNVTTSVVGICVYSITMTGAQACSSDGLFSAVK